jgi:hypothetical protein
VELTPSGVWHDAAGKSFQALKLDLVRHRYRVAVAWK